VKPTEPNNTERDGLLKRCTGALTTGTLRLLSRCSMRVLYGVSDLMYALVYHVVRYRVRVVRDNLRSCFPEKSAEELRAVERRFYHYFCDLAVEIVKLTTISGEELKSRVEVRGLEAVEATFAEHPFCVCYLGHYCNWEWLTVLPLYLQRGGMSQIYHPMRNRAFDRWFCDNRSRFGAVNIPMKQTLRRLVALKAEGRGYLLGCIADQLPKSENIHHHTTFLGRRTAVFTGSEKIGERMNASYAYAQMQRERRGHYTLTFHLMDVEAIRARAAEGAATEEERAERVEFAMTDEFMRLLEQDIRRAPEFWLWSHKRWKR
jgi:KDO2-lipid IV(A) lauroyltransferase